MNTEKTVRRYASIYRKILNSGSFGDIHQKIFCMTDTTSYENLTRHVTFIRHSDLSDGNACHDEIIRRERA